MTAALLVLSAIVVAGMLVLAFADVVPYPERTEMSTAPEASRDLLETFPNSFPGREYAVETTCPEFTSVCPKTGQPDFGVIVFTYQPRELCVELKSLKLYLQQFRNAGIFYENISNRIFDDLVATLDPEWLSLEASFSPRGGISTKVRLNYAKQKPQA